MSDINCTMDKDAIRYAIAKQTSSMDYIHTAYGDLDLDSELSEAVQEAIERVLYKRIDERPRLILLWWSWLMCSGINWIKWLT